MATNGLRFYASKLDVKVESTLSATTTGTGPFNYFHEASYSHEYLINSLLKQTGIYLHVSSGYNDKVSVYETAYTVSGSVAYSNTVSSYKSTASLTVRFNNVRIYARKLLGVYSFYFVCAGGEVFEETTSVHTFGVITSSSISGAIMPGFMPIFGLPPTIEGGKGGSGNQTTGNFSFVVDLNQTISGGLRYTLDDIVWINPSVVLPIFGDVPSGGAPFNLSPPATVVSTNMWGTHIESTYLNENSRTGCGDIAPASSDVSSTYGRVTLIPNVQVNWTTFNDYDADIIVRTLPKTVKRGTRFGCDDCTIIDVLSGPVLHFLDETEHEEVIHQRLRVTDGHPELTDLIGRDVPCPVVMQTQRQTGQNAETDCDDPAIVYDTGKGEILTLEFPQRLEMSPNYFSPLAWAGLDISARIENYYHFIANTSYSVFFFGDDWEINDTITSYDIYWGQIRQQLLEDWTEGEEPEFIGKFRNTIHFDPYNESAYQDYLKPIVGKDRWVGASRFDIIKETIEDVAFNSDSASLFMPNDCTLSHGVNVTVTPTALNCTIELYLNSLLVYPYLAKQLRDIVALDWVGANIVETKVYVANNWDDENNYLLELNPGDGFTTAGEEYNLEANPDSVYAGTTGIDNGYSFSTPGTDLFPEGESDAIFNNTLMQGDSALLSGCSGYKLVFEFTLDSLADFTLIYPVLKFDELSGNHNVIENPSVTTTVREQGGITRVGNNKYTSAGTLLTSPFIVGKGYKLNVIDILCNINVLQGRPYDFDLVPTLETYYDSFETPTVGAYSYSDTLGIFWGVSENSIVYSLTNTLRELPPVALFPSFVFDASTLTFGEDVDLAVVSSATKTTNFICRPGFSVIDGDLNEVTTLAPVIMGTWAQLTGKLYLPEIETDNYYIRYAGKDWMKFWPWEGHTIILSIVPSNSEVIDYVVSKANEHFLFYIQLGKLYLDRFSNQLNLLSSTLIHEDAVYVSAAKNANGDVFCIIIDSSGNLKILESEDRWDSITSTTLKTGMSKCDLTITKFNLNFIYSIDSSDNLICDRYDADWNLLQTAIIDTGVDNTCLASYHGNYINSYRIYLVYFKSGIRRHKYSTDGITFTSI